jgi:hypothetical protein
MGRKVMIRYKIILAYNFSYDTTMGVLCEGSTLVKDKDKNIVYGEGYQEYVIATLVDYVLDFLHGNIHDISIVYMLERR